MSEAKETLLNIKVAIGNKVIPVPYTIPKLQSPDDIEYTTAEDVCIFLCKRLEIGSIARHIFGLRDPKQNYLMPAQTFDGKSSSYELRIRYKIPNIFKLKKIDPKAYNYYFHQIRNDVFENKISDLPFEKYRKEIVGLGITDMYRVMLEENISQETVENDYKKYIPKEVFKKHIFFIRKPIHDTLSKIKVASHDANFVKDQYIKQLEILAPDYPAEEYRGLIEKEGVGYNILLRITPFNETEPGIKYKYESKRDNQWTVLCTIKELGFISIRRDNSVEISRTNGVPFYIKFNSMALTRSFVSLLDGYYRLSVKWTFNICKEVVTPSLNRLYSLKCHGPVGGEFSYAKLEEKRSNRMGCFIIRESECNYHHCFIDVCSKEGKPKTFKIERLNNEEFVFHDDLTKFRNLGQLMAKYNDPTGNIFLSDCVPPSEYDDSQLLLCKNTVMADKVLSNGDIENVSLNQPVCINTGDLQVYSTEIKSNSIGNFLNIGAEWVADFLNSQVSNPLSMNVHVVV